MKNYPIKFRPIFKDKVWGGTKLKSFLGKNIQTEKVGESWEISAVKDDLSIVSNGIYKGRNISELIGDFKGKFIGEKVYKKNNGEFPLLFKFIDAADDLSMQLHPNDKLARKRHNSFGKTEMWYVLEADVDSKLYAGFKEGVDKKLYKESVSKAAVVDCLQVDYVKRGDAFFIAAGTIHAIGKGILLAEIQQTSDVTYRVYDWDRLDINGQYRELHLDLAEDAIDFTKVGSQKCTTSNDQNKINNIFSCSFFTTNKLKLDCNLTRDFSSLDSFVVYMCVDGNAEIDLSGEVESINKGEVLLIPANTAKVVVLVKKRVELLEIYI